MIKRMSILWRGQQAGNHPKPLTVVFFNRGIIWSWIAIIVVAIDRLTKVWAVSHLPFSQPVNVSPYFNLFFTYNPGAAFSFLSHADGWQDWFFGGIAVLVSSVIIVWLCRLSRAQVWVSLAVSFILGGTIGNLYDRIAYARVIDFLDFYYQNWHWPTFNIADTAICIGAIMLVIDAIRKG